MSASLSLASDVPTGFGFVHGSSAAVERLNRIAGEIARTCIPVLIMGESGTGKEVYGRLIHRLSKLCDAPLKKLSCRVLNPGDLLEQLKSGTSNCLTNDQGRQITLFLDGIDELDIAGQNLLLSLLPDGDEEEDDSKIRFIASASCRLEVEVAAGRFRRELYFRISGACLRLPALRERKEDIPALLEHFFRKYAASLQVSIPILREEEMNLLHSYSWPGNIRELENLARNILVIGDARSAIEELCVPAQMTISASDHEPTSSLKRAARSASRQAERELILKALERTHWNRKRAAQELQISYKSLLHKIKQAGVEGKAQGASKELK
jgi:two-component system, NtrC family, response regulator AtoC